MKIVGIIGCGAIGTVIADAVEKGIVVCDKLILHDLNKEKAEKLMQSLHVPTTVVENLDELIRLKPKVIVEAASQQAAKMYAGRIVDSNIELIVMSVGALLESKVKNSRVHVPSGAVGGLDAISSAALAGVDEVVLTTRKSHKTLDIANDSEELVYSGGPEEAVKRFPREMNVAATLALIVQPEKVKVQVISDPKAKRTVHEIKVKWKQGDMFLRFSNEPHPGNPKTSALAAWSAVSLLKEILEKC